MNTDHSQVKKWILPKPINEDEITNVNLDGTLQKILIRRGLDLKNELDEYINDSLFSSYTKTAFDFIASKSAKDYQILFLEIDSPPPDLI